MMKTKIFSAIIIGLALILSATAFGGFYYSAQSVNSNDSLAVTGSAKTHVVSDQAKLVISLSRIVFSDNLAAGNNGIAHDMTLTKDLLHQFNLDENSWVESPVSMNQMYDQNISENIRYQLFQTITVQSDDVTKLTEISQQIPSLAERGALVAVQSLEYYYSQLPELRVSLLTEAVKDAKARAEKIAAGTGRSVGNIQNASAGVVQVLSNNSVDVSDYGSYDTSSIEKDVMVTVKASFRLQ